MEFEFFTTLLLGFALGLTHALEPDHMVAVSTIASESKKLSRSSLTGVFWGIGHTFTLFTFSMIIILLKTSIPDSLSSGLEFFVGIMIVLLGLTTFRKYRKGFIHQHNHIHSFKKATIVGVIHGLAGSAAMILTTLSTVDSPLQAAFYILIFGAGTVIGMQLFSTAIALPFILGQKKFKIHAKLMQLVSLFSIFYGMYYMYKILN